MISAPSNEPCNGMFLRRTCVCTKSVCIVLVSVHMLYNMYVCVYIYTHMHTCTHTKEITL